MKTGSECLQCFMRQTSRLARRCGLREDEEFRLLQAVAGVVSECAAEKSPPENAIAVYTTISRLTGLPDPYKETKVESNRQAAAQLGRLEKMLAEIQDDRGAAEMLATLLRLVVAGNIMDFGALESFDLDATLARSLTQPLAIDHCRFLSERLAELANKDMGGEVLYLTDNCGEIVLDQLLVRFLAELGLSVTVAVREKPIINDATVEDAYFAGLDNYAQVITNGTGCPGTPLAICSDEFRAVFSNAELIIAKGQGNFESLSEIGRDIFFLLALKCSVAARHMAELNGMEPHSLPGAGEFVIYYSGNNH